MSPAGPEPAGDPLAGLPLPPWHPEPLSRAAAAQRAAAGALTGVASRAHAAVAGVVGPAWTGMAATSAGQLLARLAAAHDDAARHAEAAAATLEACAATWEHARGTYQQARRLADEALREEQAGYTSPLRPRAGALARQAIDEVQQAARSAAAALDAHARALAPVPPPPVPHRDHGKPWYEHVLSWLGDRSEDLAGAGRSLLNFGGYATTHPGRTLGLAGDAAGIALGLMGIAAGTGGELVGAAADTSIVGLPIGIPLNAASAGLIFSGATVTGVSALKANQDLGAMWAEAQSESSGGAGHPPPSAGRSVDEILSGLRAGRNTPNLEVDTAGELHAVFDELSAGGTPVHSGYPGKLVELADGTRVGLRGTSRSGGETIDVFKPDGSYRKVHLP
ncbi:MAG TPA: hypothetical protein VF486_21320 [Actinomycetes bacterium]